MAKANWIWDIDLRGMVGQFAYLETNDGIVREGKITKVEMRDLPINDDTFTIPSGLELNNDIGDLIEFRQIKFLKLS